MRQDSRTEDKENVAKHEKAAAMDTTEKRKSVDEKISKGMSLQNHEPNVVAECAKLNGKEQIADLNKPRVSEAGETKTMDNIESTVYADVKPKRREDSKMRKQTSVEEKRKSAPVKHDYNEDWKKTPYIKQSSFDDKINKYISKNMSKDVDLRLL